jgi:glucokinase
VSDGDAIGIDVGGTKINAFRVTPSGSVEERAKRETQADDPEAILREMIDLASEMRDDGIVAVGIGAAGLVDARTGVMRFSPNLAWREMPIRERMRDALGLPVLLENDASAAAYGEWRFGAGRGVDHMLLVAVGTGIGGGLVDGGKLYRGAHGFATEIGHIIVEPGGPLCGCGNLGCLEQVAAGRAIGRLGREAAREHEHSMLRQLASGDPDAVTGELVTEAAQRGDDVAIRVLRRVGRRLGEGIAGLVNVLDPDVVVVGGGVIVAGDLLLEPARAAFLDAVEGPAHRDAVPLVPAELGNDAGAIGAAALALDELVLGS